MFQNNDNDDELDLDLDEVVKFTNAPAGSTLQNSFTSVKKSEERADLKNSTVDNKISQLIPQPPTKNNEWGSDDDSELFLSVLEPDLSNKNHKENSPKPQPARKVVIYSPKENLQPLVVPKPKFPGPAGLPLPALSSANDSIATRKGKKRQKINFNHTNLDGLCYWEKALSAMGVTEHLWRAKKMNLQAVKETFAPNVVYLTAPLLILGVQRIDYAPVIRNDVNCILQDPTGEVRGSILQQVVLEHGKLIQVGAVLILRRPSLLQYSSNCVVTVSKNCLVGIYSVNSIPAMTQCRPFEKKDILSWMSEPMVRGNPVRSEDEEVHVREPPVRLFSSDIDARSSTSAVVTPQRKDNSGYSRLLDLPPPRTAITPNNRLAANNHPNAPSAAVRQNAPSVAITSSHTQFQLKAPSAVVVTPSRATPYPSSACRTAGSSPSTTDKESAESENLFLSQFLEGVDTDALFTDDF